MRLFGRKVLSADCATVSAYCVCYAEKIARPIPVLPIAERP